MLTQLEPRSLCVPAPPWRNVGEGSQPGVGEAGPVTVNGTSRNVSEGQTVNIRVHVFWSYIVTFHLMCLSQFFLIRQTGSLGPDCTLRPVTSAHLSPTEAGLTPERIWLSHWIL